jgi:hypothetical protein
MLTITWGNQDREDNISGETMAELVTSAIKQLCSDLIKYRGGSASSSSDIVYLSYGNFEIREDGRLIWNDTEKETRSLCGSDAEFEEQFGNVLFKPGFHDSFLKAVDAKLIEIGVPKSAVRDFTEDDLFWAMLDAGLLTITWSEKLQASLSPS